MQQKIFFKKIKNTIFRARVFFAFSALLIPIQSKAAVLLPGNISSCGELAVPGTYTLTQNITGDANTCFLVSSDNVVIEGAGFTITGSAATAIDGRAYTSGSLTAGANAYTNLIINDITLSGYATGINLSGNADTTGNGVNNGYGGDAGDVAVFYSYVGGVTVNGGDSSSKSFGGLGGNVAFTDTNLNISNSTISALGGVGATGWNTDGGLSVTYSGTLNKTNLVLSALSYLNENSTSYGVYMGGSFPTPPGNVSSCGTLIGSGTYTLTQDVVSTSTCFVIGSNDVFINGNGHSITAATTTLSFAINANTVSNFTLASTTVNTFTNLITSGSSVTVSGHNLDLSNKYIATGSLTLNYTGTLNRIGATISSLFLGLTVNGIDYGLQNGGALLEWIARDSERNWVSVASNAAGNKLAAVDNDLGHIYTSSDYGATWTARGDTQFWTSVASNAAGDRLVAVAYSGQIYTSNDSGVTWTAISGGNRYWQSVASNSRGDKLVAVAQGDQIYTSNDYGATWTAHASNKSWISVASNAAGDRLAAVVQGGQIYTSSDSGATWTARDSDRNWFSIASNAAGDRLVALEDGGLIYLSDDYGTTWVPLDFIANWQSVASNSAGNMLAAVVSAGQIYISNDYGTTWTVHDSVKNWTSIASNAAGDRLAAVVYAGRIYTYQDNFPELKVDILSPLPAATPSSWQPIVSWGGASSCYYSYDNFVSTSTANCASLGSDIASPGYGSKTLYVKGIDANTAVVQKNVSFTLQLPIVITAPASDANVTSWNPVVGWDPASSGNITNCYYSYNNFVSTSTANCSGTGGDILPPANQGANTLSLKVVNSNGVVGINTVSFIYSTIAWTARDFNRNWMSVASNSAGDKLAAVVYGGQIYTSTSSGATWTARDSARTWWSITSNSAGDKLAAVVYGGQIYTSTSSGATWTAQASGSRTWYSIASNSAGDRLVAVVQGGQIYTSSDSGVTWTARESSRQWLSVASNATGDRLAAVVDGGQIYTSNDYGATWTARESSRTWASIASNAAGDRLAAVAYSGQIYTSNDYGATWTARDSNRGWRSVASNAAGDRLAAVVGSGQIYISNDYGAAWTASDSSRNWRLVASNAAGDRLAAVVGSGQIYTYDSSSSNISIIRPTASSSVLARAWSTLVNWGSSVSCYYSYDNFVSTSTANCASLGNDIARPLVRDTNTLYVKGVDALSNITTKFVTFDFDLFSWTAHESNRNWVSIASNAAGDRLAAIIFAGQIYTSSDSGVTWTPRESSRQWRSIASNSAGDRLAAVVPGGQIYTSSDYGSTWTARDSNRTWTSIASNAAGDKLVAAVGNGGQIFTSTSSGATWTAQASGSRNWQSVASNAAGDRLVAAVYGGQIFTSNDSGATWTAQASGSRNWQSVASNAAGDRLAAVVQNGQIYTSSDYGATWTAQASGSRNWQSVASNAAGDRLAAVVQNGQIYTSSDYGATWTARESSRSWYSIASNAAGDKLAAVVGSGKIYINSSIPYTSSPTSLSTVTTWSPVVDWSNALTCEYSYNSSTWSGVSCNNAGSDIPVPSVSGLTTLYLKGTDYQSVVSTSSVTFTYLQTQSGNSISSCGNISTSGTYTLTQNITGVAGTCFNISANNVTIDGAGFTVTAAGGNSSYAVTSGSYTGVNLKDIRFIGFGQGSVSSSATVTYSGTDVNLTNSTTTANALVIAYTNTFTVLNTYFSNISSLIINNIDLGYFSQGLFTWNQQNISTCQTLSSPGNYKLTADITNVSGTCFAITSDKVIIDGDGHTVSSAGGNTSFAIDATLIDGQAYSNIGVKNLTLTGFGAGVDARGADGVTGDASGKNGGTVSLYNVNFPTDIIAVNTNGGNAYYEFNDAQVGGSAGNVKVTNSIIGTVNINGGDAVGNFSVGYDNGSASGGSSGSVTNTNSTIGVITSNPGLSYIPGCMDTGASNYYPDATYDDGSCTNLAIGSERDNPQGNTVGGPITFNYYNNYGTVNGDAYFYDADIYYNNGGGGFNYGTTTGHATFDNSYYGSGADNLGYVGGGADFIYYSSNAGTVDGGAGFYFGSNNGTINGFASLSNGANNGTINGGASFDYGYNGGTINGNADFTNNGFTQGYNYGTVNGDAIFWSSDYNAGTVTGNITYIYGCIDPAASNYVNAQNDNGSCQYYGSTSDVPGGVTVNGPITFQNGYSNYGTIQGDATFGYGSYNYGTVTGDAQFAEIAAGTGGDPSVLQLDQNYFDTGNTYSGTGFVGGSIFDTNNQTVIYIVFDGINNYTTTSAPHVIMRNGGINYGTIHSNDIQMEDSINNAYLEGTVYFNGPNSVNAGEFANVQGDAHFENYSSNSGTVTGNAYFALSGGSAYSSETPPSGTMYLVDHDWAGEVTGTVYGSDNQPITTYVFSSPNGSLPANNYGTLNGNAIFNDFSINYSRVNGNAIFNNSSSPEGGTVTGSATLNTDHFGEVPLSSTFTLSNNWFANIQGSLLASDGTTPITDFILNGSATNFGTINASSTTFNALSSNNGTVNGNAVFTGAAFQIGTVNGTVTLSGLAQTIQGTANVINFIKHALSRDTLYFEYGSTLNVSGLASILGADGGNLLTLRSNSPGSYATLNINGTSDLNNLRIKDIRNTGLSQDISAKTVFNDGGNTGFIFPTNTTPSSRGAVTSQYTPPAIPPSRLPPVTVTPTAPAPTPAPTPARATQSGTIDSFFAKTIAPIVFKDTAKFDVVKADGKGTGTTYIPNPLQNLVVKTALDFTKLPTNFLSAVSKFLFAPTSSNFSNYPAFSAYLASKGINVSKPQDIVTLGSKPIRINATDEIDVPGVYAVNAPSSITYDKATGAVVQLVKTEGGKSVSVSLLGTTKVTGTYAKQPVTFSPNGKFQTVTITTPTKPGTYTLETLASPIPLVIQVVEPVKPVVDVKKGGIINWIKSLFN